MNKKKWEAWVKGEIDVREQPPMLIADPKCGAHVLISLIDKVGHESRAVVLPPWWFPERPQKR